MKHHLLAGVAFAAATLLSSAAIAADPPLAPPPMAPPPMEPLPVFHDWTGVFVGGHVGYNWEKKKVRYPGFEHDDGINIIVVDPLALTINSDGFHAGVQVGANWQRDEWVFGVIGDISWTNAKGSQSALAHFDAPLVTAFDPQDVFPLTFKQRIKWFGTLRGRVGYAFDNVLIYGTGGFAWKRSQVSVTGLYEQPNVPAEILFAGSDTKTHWGWTIGGGVEAALDENWSIFGEYLFMRFRSKTYNLHAWVNDDLVHTPTHVKFDQHVLRVGLNYRFVTAPPAPAPVPVKY